jgi:hypothetical protein
MFVFWSRCYSDTTFWGQNWCALEPSTAFSCKGKTVSQTEPINDLFVLLIELDEDENGNFPMQE